MEERVNALYEEFHATYPYVCIDKLVVEDFCREFDSCNVHLLYDYVLSQDLADEVEL